MSVATETPIIEVIEWARAQKWSAFAMSIADTFAKGKGLSDRQESAIRAMFAKQVAKPVAPVAPAEPVTEAGMYRKAGVVFRVKQARQGRNFYALRYVPEALVKADRFVYEAGAIRRLSPADRLTLDEAKALGHHFGICCVCGAELSDPKSVEAGIGPVCAKRV